MAHKLSDMEDYNRIFIIGSRDCSTDDVREAFSKFGQITDIYFPIIKATRERKGVIYVTFSKASEAALAIEQMNGKNELNCRSLKVVLASSKKDGSVRDPNEEAKMLRLFIMIPSNYREKDVEEEFKQFGTVVSVHIVKDKKTSDGRGLAYVKFSRAYDAAKALENCSPHFKPVFADAPKPRIDSRPQQRSDRFAPVESTINARFSDYSSHSRSTVSDFPTPAGRGLPEAALATLDLLRNYSVAGQGETVLEASFPVGVGYEQVQRLFDLIPGLEGCKYDQNSGKAFVKYSTPQAAAYARDKMDTLEYPIGYRIIVRFPNESSFNGMYGNEPVDNTLGNVQTLVDSIQKATALLQQAGIGVGGAMLGGPSAYPEVNDGYSGQGQMYKSGGQRQLSNFCSARLPDRQPFAPKDARIVERLFLVSQPDIFDNDLLEDVFCRFGNMIGAYFMPGKKFGYVKYADAESARKAMDIVHGQTICGNRLKVLPAEPLRRRTDDSSKRDHSAGDWPMTDEDDVSAPRGKQSRYD